ncbi:MULTISPECIES: trypsin-like peptidase domain-containing protein [Corallococcus]|uniref:trypsin-like peptidase domain-containing protein n=1 Tax=Corallococcus TaxID=83461 RepID=UPI00117DC21B|nr:MULTISPECIES: trypsin-like peptidase domain-containing protein [Corallococcus]NBD13732.1 serine protease [Corallococcus silvisoli]TSC22825.1 trypsin-like peptidase domain-containing protein [Corallococcus sp. Z5C101001]
MELEGSEQEELTHALLGAFTSVEELYRMVAAKCGRTLLVPSVEREGAARARALVHTAEAEGWTDVLVRGAQAAAPGHPRIRRFLQGYLSSVQRSVSGSALARIVQASRQALTPEVWRDRLTTLSRRVCRVELDGGRALGTGFLVAPDVVLTNSHVIENRLVEALRVRFDLKVLPDRIAVHPGRVYAVTACLAQSPHSPADLMHPRPREATRDELDYAFLQIQDAPGEDRLGDRSRGFVPLAPPSPTAFAPGSLALVVQHPKGRPMQVALDTFQAINRSQTRVTYCTNTHPGSSGSPCFTPDLELVALHHSGDPRPGHEAAEDDEGIPLDTIRDSLPSHVLRRLGWD